MVAATRQLLTLVFYDYATGRSLPVRDGRGPVSEPRPATGRQGSQLNGHHPSPNPLCFPQPAIIGARPPYPGRLPRRQQRPGRWPGPFNSQRPPHNTAAMRRNSTGGVSYLMRE